MIPDQKVKIKWHSVNKKYYESLGYIFTKIGDEFEVNIKDLPKGSHALVKFICDYCNGKNQMTEKSKWKIYNNLNKSRKKTGKDCCDNHECRNKKNSETHLSKPIPENNTFAKRFPELLSEWHYEKNNKLPNEVSYKSDLSIWWICEKGHEWKAKVFNRANGGKCPYCLGRKVCADNCLATTHSELAKEWHPTKNGKLTPYDVVYGSNKKVWWKCKNGHEWQATINNRTNPNTNNKCPYCSNKKVYIGNCLMTIHPNIAEEWHYTLNKITPYDVTYGSSKKVWWMCKKCNHEWKAAISQRVRGRGCPVCNESKGEKRIREYLEKNNIIYKSQYEFKNLRGVNGGFLKFDFAIFDDNNNLKMLIEYDGAYHFGKLYENDGYEIRVIHDKKKDDYCKQNNIPLLRIPYWEFDNIENILAKEL
ncbi:zinc-ribbon domain-containing protein [Anoxybacillus flavithermus]|uniref:zinc-ribbon domain-containing protein n=1 Tax=Anoxybacillus flavithermus TaxID=33934 RepID=UPI0018678BC2|nr:zinc-ribbon domain-containing protein [Anoxybacillus flavithermus]MBE2919382.1 zinc-ribbon domain-containing protein [Anoxybacillus flavithermus]